MTARLIEMLPAEPEQGLCWVIPAPPEAGSGDGLDAPQRSTLRLFEDGKEIGPAHTQHEEIRRLGGGRFSHWGDRIYLSVERAGQHHYTALVELADDSGRRALLANAAGIEPDTLEGEQCYAWGERLFNAFVPEVKLSEYGRSFFRDREFMADYERFDQSNYRSLDRKFTLRALLQLALRRPGELAECGVFRGGSAYLMAKAIRAAGTARRLHLFDSFAGLSAPGPADGNYWQSGSLACSAADVATNLSDLAVLAEFHSGWIPQRFGDVADLTFCFVHIDVDLFQPTHDALHFFYPRMTRGGVILCDDYGFDTCPGARQAVDRFFANRPEPVLHLPTGQGVVMIESVPSA